MNKEVIDALHLKKAYIIKLEDCTLYEGTFQILFRNNGNPILNRIKFQPDNNPKEYFVLQFRGHITTYADVMYKTKEHGILAERHYYDEDNELCDDGTDYVYAVVDLKEDLKPLLEKLKVLLMQTLSEEADEIQKEFTAKLQEISLREELINKTINSL